MALKKIDLITHWVCSGSDGYGSKSYEAPVERSCRWDPATSLTYDAEGVEFVSNGVIYDDVAEGRIKEGDRVLREPLAEGAGKIDSSFICRSTREDRNGTGTKFLYTAMLSKKMR